MVVPFSPTFISSGGGSGDITVLFPYLLYAYIGVTALLIIAWIKEKKVSWYSDNLFTIIILGVFYSLIILTLIGLIVWRLSK